MIYQPNVIVPNRKLTSYPICNMFIRQIFTKCEDFLLIIVQQNAKKNFLLLRPNGLLLLIE